MVKREKKWQYILVLFILIFYALIAPRPIPIETILKPLWITSLEGENSPELIEKSLTDGSAENGIPMPFTLGNRFGYVGETGKFSINKTSSGYLSISDDYWSEYEAFPSRIEIMNPGNESIFTIDKPKGYPLLLDSRVFIVGSEQNFITALGENGEELWTHDFPAPITCVDVSGGFLLAGTLDGAVLLLNSSGALVFPPFEPGGSKFPVILGCAISRDGTYLALISGIDAQRFLLMERTADSYKVVYHEFLSTGFRRPTHITFAHNDSRVVFEREGGLGIYAIGSKNSISVAIDGEIEALDGSGSDGFLFVISTGGEKSAINEKHLITIRYPGSIISNAPFKSDNTFLAHRNRKLYIGGDLALASLKLENK